jgi:purine-binding chemotaxis protein CheW
MEQQTLLSFRVAEQRLALPFGAVRYVAPVPLLKPPVTAPYFVEGFFDFQGAPVAAIRLDRLLNLGDAKLGLYTPLLLLAGDEQAIALHVDGVDGILSVAAALIQPIDDDETLNGCITGRISVGADTVYLVDTSRLLLAAEREKLAAHHDMTQRRLEALSADVVPAA